jgi:hypothetical protein
MPNRCRIAANTPAGVTFDSFALTARGAGGAGATAADNDDVRESGCGSATPDTFRLAVPVPLDDGRGDVSRDGLA